MYHRGKRGRPKDSPTVAIAKATELIKAKKHENAMKALFESISYRHRAQFDQTYEEAMKMYIDVGVSILKSCKEGFLHYRSLVQQNHPQSLQKMINHLVSGVERVGNEEVERLGIDNDAQYESKTLKYEWEQFQTVLMILRNNGKLNNVYKSIVVKCIAFCKKLKRSKEFRKLCDTIRRRFGYVINNQTFDYALKINSSETLNSMFETRLNLLQCALSMELHQESFKTIKDIQKNIIDRAYDLKKNIDPLIYSKFYKKLSLIFWSSNRYLLHSYALFESYKKLRIYILTKIPKKQKEQKATEMKKLHIILQEALLSVLLIPASAINDEQKGNQGLQTNKDYTHSLYQLANDFFNFQRNAQLIPSKEGLLNIIIKEINSLNVVKEEAKEKEKEEDGKDDDYFANIKNLYAVVILNKFTPLSFTRTLNELCDKLENDNNVNIDFYRTKIYEMGVMVLLRQLSFCYKSISWLRFKQLTFSSDQLSDIELERIITFCVYYGNICCRISHSDKLITFYDNNLESSIFCKSIIELNDVLISINKITEEQSNNDDIQRHNVFNQIRNKVTDEHNKIQTRLNKIRRTVVIEQQIKKEKERKKKEIKDKEKEIKNKMEQKEAEAVKQSKTNQLKNQEKKEEKTKIYQTTKKKWNQMVKQQPINAIAAKYKNKVKNDDKKVPKASSKLIQIEVQENILKREIERGLDRKDGNINVEDTQNKMKKLEKVQKRKQKKILEIEKIEYDYFSRAKRKYLQQNILRQIEDINKLNVKEQKLLFRKENKENKEKYKRKIIVRDRLREIKEKHFAKFMEIVKTERTQKQNKQQKELKQSKKRKETKQKQQKLNKTSTINQKSLNSKAKTPKAVKQISQTQTPKQAPKQTKQTQPKPKPKPKPKPPQAAPAAAAPKTFSEKMKAKRVGSGASRGFGASASMSFGERFSRQSFGGQSAHGQSFGASAANGNRDRARFGQRNNTNYNNNNETNIRPK